MKTRILLTLLFVSSFAFAQLPTDHLASYEFINGSLVNNTNPGNGDLSGGAVANSLLRTDRNGVANSAIRNEKTVRNGYQLTGTNNNVSVSFWIAGAGSPDDRRILQIYDSSGHGFDITAGASNTLKVRFKSSSTKNASQSGSPVFNAGWHHVVVTINKIATGYDNSVYIDGALQSGISSDFDSTDTGNFLTGTSTFVMSPLGTHYGNFDEIKIFDRTLTAAEINSLYTSINGATGASKYYVDINATGNNDGSSWNDAFTNLQTGLAYSTSNTSEIWVAKGTYIPGTSRASHFDFDIDNLSIYGGVNGTETTLSERDINANPTILSGDANGNDSGLSTNHDSNTTRYDNSYNVVVVSANNILIDGLKIEDGYANHTTTENLNRGGAIRIESTSENLILRNCEMNHNFSLYGGINVYFDIDTQMTIENCKFHHNVAKYGAGLYVLVDDNRTVTLNITNTLFTSNTSLNIYNTIGYTGSSAWLRANSAGSTLNTTITNCTFAYNADLGTSSNTERGTLSLSKNTAGTSTHNATINNSIFYGNTRNGVTTLAVSKGHTSSVTTAINNSIDEGSFSNISASNLTNTINGNPMFTSTTDYTLQSGSPAIDTGDNSKIPTGITTDLLGNNRIFNTTVDMGAYEFGSSTLGAENFKLVENEVSIYPNPSISVLNIRMKNTLKRATVYSVLGSKVLETTFNSIDTSNLKSGIYLIKIEAQNGSVSSKRFMKK